MSAKRFHVARPDQLQSLVKYAKNNAPTIARTARIWKIAKDKNGTTRWDTGVYVSFSGDMAREAVVFRAANGDEPVEVGTLKYNIALNWCEEHLKPLEY